MITSDDLKNAIQLIRNSIRDFEISHSLSDAEIQPLLDPNNLNHPLQKNIEFNIRWILPTQDRRRRPARIIKLIIPRDHIDDDGLLGALRNGIDGFRNFLNTVDPNYNNPPPSKTTRSRIRNCLLEIYCIFLL